MHSEVPILRAILLPLVFLPFILLINSLASGFRRMQSICKFTLGAEAEKDFETAKIVAELGPEPPA